MKINFDYTNAINLINEIDDINDLNLNPKYKRIVIKQIIQNWRDAI